MFGLRHTPSAAPFFSLALALLLAGCGDVDTQADPDTAPPAQVAAEAVPAPQHDAKALEAAMATIPAGGTDDERIRAILLHLKAKRDSITSYTMDIAWERYEFPETPIESPLPNGVKVNYGEGTWTEQDGMWRVHRRKRWERPETPDPNSNVVRPESSDQGEYESWAVYNREYYAERFGDSAIQLYSQLAIDTQAVNPKPELYPFPLDWGFGTGNQREMYGYFIESEKVVDWTLEDFDDAGGPKLRMRMNPRDATGAGSEFILDVARDYLFISVAGWQVPGQPFQESKIELQQLAGGQWFPHRITKRKVDGVQLLTFSKVQLNVELDKEQFGFEAFDFDRNNTVLIQRSGDDFRAGRRMLYRDGQWVPEAMVPREQRPEKKREVLRFNVRNES